MDQTRKQFVTLPKRIQVESIADHIHGNSDKIFAKKKQMHLSLRSWKILVIVEEYVEPY